jgi:hypothetical protein
MCSTPLPALLVLATLAAGLAHAQRLQPGQRVRVTAPALGIVRHPAHFQALRNDSLVVVVDAGSQTLPVSSITRLEVARTPHGHPWTGAAVGAGVGALTGVVVGLSVGEEQCTASCGSLFCFCITKGQAAAGLGFGGALGGAFIGMIVGALIKTDGWADIPPDQLRLIVVSRAAGVGFGVRVGF